MTRVLDSALLVWVRQAAVTGVARDLRVGALLSTADVGLDVGVSSATVVAWEAGELVPRSTEGLAYGRVVRALWLQSLSSWWDPGGAGGGVGPAGPAGPAGPQGLPGAAGAQGVPGSTGADGLAGAAGAQGLPGAAGAAGPAGPQGLPGADGAQGLQGLPGPQGIQGLPGADGAQGPQGLIGNTGTQGLPGETGPQGPPGADGAQGLQGIQGIPGPGGATYAKIVADLPAFTSATLANVTGLSFPVTSGLTYRFRFDVIFRSAATATGIRLGLTTPAFTALAAKAEIPIAADAAAATMHGWITTSGDSVLGTGVQAATTDYLAHIEGVITPSANGTVQLQAATEVAASAVTVRAGSHTEWLAI